jgi:filamentous hemagglutinin family protein
MNRCYRLVWNDVTRTWTVASELARRRGKRASGCALLAVCVCATAAPPTPSQLPAGGQVVAGQAAIASSGARMDVNQVSQRAAIDWQSFNVGSAAHLNFNQPSTDSVILNRVRDTQASQIFGRITANGQVFLSNPNGIYFAPGASVDVGALVATTGSIANSDFMEGRYRFTRNGATGAIRNEGQLRAALGGYIALLAPEVRNQGVIVARMGTVALAAGDAYELQFDGNHTLANLRVTPATVKTLVDNGNAVQAPGGLIILSAQGANQLQGSVVNNSGVLEATALSQRGGRIFLDGGESGQVTVSGRIDASAANGAGGVVEITAQDAALLGARIDAGGLTQGGTIHAGGGWQGGGSLRHAQQLLVDAGSVLDASSAGGAGGEVVAWSDQSTQFSGTANATGAAGGKIEISSRHSLHYAGAANAGRGGNVLFDPKNIVVDVTASPDSVGSASFATSPAADSTITPASITAILDTGSNVTLQANNDITVNSVISASNPAGSGGALTLEAGRSIAFNAAVNTGNGNLTVTAGAAGADPANRDAGTATITLANGVTLNAGSGAMTLAADALALNGSLNGTGSLQIKPATANTSIGIAGGSGGLVMSAANFSANIGSGFSGITIGSTNAGDITIGNTALNFNAPLTLLTPGAITVNSGAALTSANRALILNADADANGGKILINDNTTINTGGGAIVLGGGTCTANGCTAPAAATGAAGTQGIVVLGSSGNRVTLNSGGGAIRMWGKGGTGGGGGVLIGYTTVDSGATGSIDLRGDGWYVMTPGGNGDGLRIFQSSFRGGSGGLSFTGNVNTNNTGQWSFAIVLDDSTAYTTGGGTLSLAASAPQGFGNNYYIVGNGTYGDAALQNGNMSISYSGTSTMPMTLPNIVLPSGDLTVNLHRSLTEGNMQVVGGATAISGGGTAFDIALGTAGSFNGGTITVSNARNVSILDSDTLALGAFTNIAGAIDIATSAGNLTVGQNIATTSTSSSAIKLNAGKNTAAGTASGGDIVVSGAPVLTTGAGGSVTLYTGSVTGSTGLAALVGTGSGRFRYNSDATHANYTSALAAGKNAIFREQPAITVTAADAARTYDGQAFSGGNGATVAGLVNGDTTALLSGSLGFGGSSQGAIDAGSYSMVPSGYANGVGYALSYVNGTLTINPAPLSLALAGATGKPYDGTTAATLNSGNFVLSGFVGSDSATVTKTAGTFGDANAGTGKTVSATLSTGDYQAAGGTNLSNYLLPGSVSGAIGTISQVPLTVTANAFAKTYDAVAYSGGNGVSYAGFVNGESSAVLGGMLTYGGSSQGALNAGSYQIVPAGLSSTNYAINYVPGALTIGKAQLTALNGGLAGTVSKVYDGTSTATLNPGNFRFSGFAGSDGATVSKTTGSYDSANAGDNKTVTVSLSGSDFVASGNTNLSNYILPTTVSAPIGTITRAPLSVTAVSASKSYDGLAFKGGNGVSYSGLVSGETSAVLGGTLSYAGSSQGATQVGSYAIVPQGLSSANYDIHCVNGTLTIDKAQLTVSANSFSKVYDGLPFAGGNGVSYAGFVNGDTAAVLGGTLGFGGSSQGAVNAGSYAIVPQGLSSANYAIRFVDGTLNIDKAALTVSADSLGKMYDGVPFAGGNGASYTGFVHGETSAVLGGLLSYAGSSQGAVRPGSYTITPQGLTSPNYRISYVDGALKIAPPPPVVTIATPAAAVKTVAAMPDPMEGWTSAASTNMHPEPVTAAPAAPSNELNAAATAEAGAAAAAASATTIDASAIAAEPGSDAGRASVAQTDQAASTTAAAASATTASSTSDGSRGEDMPAAATSRETRTTQSTDASTSSLQQAAAAAGDASPAARSESRAATSATLTNAMAASDSPMAMLDAFAGTRVNQAIASGMSPAQAAQAGNAYSAVLVQKLSQGVPMSEAAAMAERVFQAEARFPAPASPREAAARNAMSSGQDAGAALGTLAQAQSAAGSGAFEKSLGVALSKGMSVEEAVKSAQQAAAQADKLARADDTPRAALASGSADRFANASPDFRKILGALLARGLPFDEAYRKAEAADQSARAAARSDALNPMSGLASGKLSMLDKKAADGAFAKVLGGLLAKGMPLAEAMSRAVEADAREQAGVKADARNPSTPFSSAHVALAEATPEFDRALGSAIARGASPANAVAMTREMLERRPRDVRNADTALASGTNIDALLAAPGSSGHFSRSFKTALGNALAKGVPVAHALALARKAEDANAFHFRLSGAAAKLAGAANGKLVITTADGKALPGWLRYDAQSKSFVASDVPEGAFPLPVIVSVARQQVRLTISEGEVRK